MTLETVFTRGSQSIEQPSREDEANPPPPSQINQEACSMWLACTRRRGHRCPPAPSIQIRLGSYRIQPARPARTEPTPYTDTLSKASNPIWRDFARTPPGMDQPTATGSRQATSGERQFTTTLPPQPMACAPEREGASTGGIISYIFRVGGFKFG